MKKIIIIILSVLLAIPSFTAVCAADTVPELPEIIISETRSSSDTRSDLMTLIWWAAGSPEPTLTENPFADITPDAPYYKAAVWLYELGMFRGGMPPTFRPDDTISRAAALTTIYRAAGSPAVEPSDLPYRDVRSDDYYYSALLWAESTSIVDTCTEGDLFSPTARLYELTVEKKDGSVKYVFHTHKWETVSETPPTCDSGGEIVRKCSACGATETAETLPLDHDFISYEIAPTCKANGYTSSFCKRCGYSTFKGGADPLGHDFGADGKAERCSRCGLFNPALKTSFNDVPSGAFFSSPVEWAVENGITTGTSAVTFSPDEGCTRGQVVTFLWRAAGCPEPAGSSNPFRDVTEGDYYYSAVLWAVENEITKGTSATEFSPDETCTRGQIVTFLWRAAGSMTSESAENPFRDVKDGDYFLQAVLWAVQCEITLGTTNTTFSPNDECTRGQVVTFLYRYLAPFGFFYGNVYVNDWLKIAFPVDGYDAAIEPFDVGGVMRVVFWADNKEGKSLEIAYVYSKSYEIMKQEMNDEAILDMFIESFKNNVADDLSFECESETSSSIFAFRDYLKKECVVEADGVYYHCVVMCMVIDGHLVLIEGMDSAPDLESFADPVDLICFR